MVLRVATKTLMFVLHGSMKDSSFKNFSFVVEFVFLLLQQKREIFLSIVKHRHISPGENLTHEIPINMQIRCCSL